MNGAPRFFRAASIALVIVATLLVAGTATAIVSKKTGPLDEKVQPYPPFHQVVGGAPLSSLASSISNGADWARFLSLRGPQDVWLDPLTGRIVSVSGAGIPWIPGAGNSLTLSDIAWAMTAPRSSAGLPELEQIARRFVDDNASLFRLPAGLALTMNRTASAPLSASTWSIRFDVSRNGITIEGASIQFVVKQGNLVLWGTSGLEDDAVAAPAVDASRALKIVESHVGGFLPAVDDVEPMPVRKILPERDGVRHGYRSVWEVKFRRKGQMGTWLARVDADNGSLLEFVDANDYAQVKGGIYPITNNAGTEVNRPLGFADYGTGLYANSGGTFTYSGGTVTSALNGKYVAIADTCGAIGLSSSAFPGDLDFGTSTGTDCITPGVGGVGNTHAARSCYYHTDLIAQKGRIYLPSNTWLQAQLTANVNLDNTCNAYWDGTTVNFFKSGGGCGNTGEIAGVFLHEWGHGMDDNDGNGAQGSGEAMGDTFAALQLRDSCIGANFQATQCGGYGNPCTACTGVRDQDRLKHQTPEILTPANIATRCTSTGSDPCGREVHCEGYLPGMTVWDLAYRDLPARPMATDDAWALADKLWWESGPTRTAAYACTNKTGAPWNNGCAASSWYKTFLAADDADGNLSNGTPHAATIFAAFDRHGISCGTAADPANQDSPECPTIGTVGTVTGSAGNNSATVTWNKATNAASYRILRNTLGCAFGFTEIAIVADNGNPTQSYTDTSAANGTPFYYVVQPIGTLVDCQGSTSNCVTVTPQPCAGTVTTAGSIYSCASTITINLLDGDLVGGVTHDVAVFSTTETTPETISLTESPASSGQFTGTVTTTSAAPVAGNGLVSVVNGDSLTIRYVDVSSCGTPNVNVDRVVSIDCAGPVISNVAVTAVTDSGATVTWTTSEPANSRVTYGAAPPPATNQDDLSNYVTSHSVALSGLASCGNYVLSVTSTDVAGNSASDSNGGSYYTFTTGARTYAIGPDNVEGGVGAWTVTTTGTTPWHIDDCKSASATHAWKAGAAQGTCPGTYGTSVVTDLTSATFALGSAGHGYHLRFNEWYSTESNTGCTYDPIVPQISTDGGTTWTNLVTAYCGASTGWQPRDIDLAAFTGNSTKVRFHFKSDSSVNQEGWYVDDIDVSHSLPSCAPLLKYETATYSDVCSAGGAGSGNGAVDPGESATVVLTARNIGVATATGVSATLSSSTPGVTITGGSASFPDIAVGATAVGGPGLAFSVSSAVTCGATLSFTAHFTSAQGSWTDTFTKRVGTAVPATNSYTSTDVPKAIPDNLPTGVESTLAIADTGTLSDVNVTIGSITHTFDADLDIYLVHPDGTVVELSTDNGSSGDNYTNTVFDDAAATSITAGVAPMTGTFRPEGSLTSLNGKPANGTWKLRVIDDASVDTGTIVSWSLQIGTQAYTCTSCSCAPIVFTTPGTPSLTSPADTATGVALSSSLSWGATANTSRYKLYLGTTNPPPFYREIASPGTSQPVVLAASTLYYWKIVSFPSSGAGASVSSPVWSFTTAAAAETVTSVSPAVINRWAGAIPFTFNGSGFGASTAPAWNGPSALPGSWTAGTQGANALSGTLTADPNAHAGWYDAGVSEGGPAVASQLRGLVVRAFSDVTEADWYFESSERMVTAGVMPSYTGAGGPEFQPYTLITRGDMAEYMVKAHFWALSQTVPARSCMSYFPDVSCAHPQVLYIEWAKDLGITLGAADGNFYPSWTVTRAEMAAFLLRLKYGGDANVPKCQPDPGWSDVASQPAWSYPYINLLHAVRISFGCSASPLTYCPLSAVQRSEIATFLSRATGALPSPFGGS